MEEQLKIQLSWLQSQITDVNAQMWVLQEHRLGLLNQQYAIESILKTLALPKEPIP